MHSVYSIYGKLGNLAQACGPLFGPLAFYGYRESLACTDYWSPWSFACLLMFSEIFLGCSIRFTTVLSSNLDRPRRG